MCLIFLIDSVSCFGYFVAKVSSRAGTVDIFQLRAQGPPLLLNAWTTANAFASGAPDALHSVSTRPTAASTVAPSETSSPHQLLPTSPLPPTSPQPSQPPSPPPSNIEPPLPEGSSSEFGQLRRSALGVEGMVVNASGTIALLLLGPPRMSHQSSSGGASQTRCLGKMYQDPPCLASFFFAHLKNS